MIEDANIQVRLYFTSALPIYSQQSPLIDDGRRKSSKKKTKKHKTMLSPYLLPLLLLAVQVSLAKTLTYDWNVTWTTANPDGQFERAVIGINGKWPVPTVEVDKGDRVIINLYNGLGTQNTSLHFHGLFQNGTTQMDGAVQVSQCAVGPGQQITYDFKVLISLNYFSCIKL